MATAKGFGAKEPEEGKGTSKVCCTFTGLPGTLLVVLLQELLTESYREHINRFVLPSSNYISWLVCGRGRRILNLFRILHISAIFALPLPACRRAAWWRVQAQVIIF